MAGQSITVYVDRAAVAPGHDLYVAIGPPQLPRRDSHRAELVLLIDASGSMAEPAYRGAAETKWSLASAAVTKWLASLHPDTGVQVTMFHLEADEVFTGTASSAAAAASRGELLPNEPTTRRTNLELAIRTAASHLMSVPAPVKRAALFSDGLANAGMTRAADLAALASGFRDGGVYFDALGFGDKADIGLLQAIVGYLGTAEHVMSWQRDADNLASRLVELSRASRHVLTTGGFVDITAENGFSIVDAFANNPQARIIGPPPDAGRIRLMLGHQGSADQRQAFILKMRAPNQATRGPIRILSASGELQRPDTQPERLGAPPESRCSVEVAPGAIQYNPVLKRSVDALLLDADLTEQIKSISDDAQLIDAYQGAIERAKAVGATQLTEGYRIAIEALKDGVNPADVLNASRASSSRPSSNPNQILDAVPFDQNVGGTLIGMADVGDE